MQPFVQGMIIAAIVFGVGLILAVAELAHQGRLPLTLICYL
jgi:hypothetical protein